MRITILLLTLLAYPAIASTQDKPDTIFQRHGLGPSPGCLVYVDGQAVDHRKDRWRNAIDELWQHSPEFVLAWIVGADEPPKLAIAESLQQRDCMVDLLVHDAAQDTNRLIIDYQREANQKAAMATLHRRYAASARVRRNMIALLTASEHRDARTQSWIWKRKFVFSGRYFNVVSEAAAQKCGIDAGQSWKPDVFSHRSCWHDVLSPADREREILQASAAPGISRHHWGTDVDLFSLNPTLFRTGRHADEYLWMTQNALLFGFFQPYTSALDASERYMEERWHWSYYPIGQALTEFALDHETEVEAALSTQWTRFENHWGKNDPAFGFVREHWKQFMFNVDTQTVIKP